MMPKKMIKIICIVLAALMVLSVGAVLIQVVAVDGTALAAAMPATGDNDGDYLIPAGIAVAAVLVIGICIALPKLKKK
ncbi:MAG: hypothetical protein PUC33_03400 [Oscillospiraceae bacterium]|nr:hypothetical protein [Oscillospiraceae bacterium]MDD6146744.1 hypothetical protein [Oscillospiraceae bacterium]